MLVEYDKVDDGVRECLGVRLDGCVDGWVMRVVCACMCICIFICVHVYAYLFVKGAEWVRKGRVSSVCVCACATTH